MGTLKTPDFVQAAGRLVREVLVLPALRASEEVADARSAGVPAATLRRVQRPLTDLLASGEPSFSFEFFPPKTDEGEAQLWQAIRELEPLGPTFVDVTYGAGGSNKDRTLRIVGRMLRETDLTVVAHLTCVGATAAEQREVVRRFADAGVRNVLALRGDPPDGPSGPWEAPEGGFAYASELVRLLHEEGDFCVGVAAFPEVHPEAEDADSDADHFVAKVRSGADFAMTQFFFDADDYTSFVARVRARGCDVPVIPGIMPVTNVRQIKRMSELSGSEFPPALAARLEAVEDDPEAVRAIGVEVATELCRRLLDLGAPGVHLYTLNRSTATREIHAALMA
jgi:methylenetetrahydrofolate reductase (NADPH)